MHILVPLSYNKEDSLAKKAYQEISVYYQQIRDLKKINWNFLQKILEPI